MDLINNQFKTLVFYKEDDKDGYVIYAAAIQSQTIDSDRYVLLFVPSHLATEKKAKISSLNWVNLQTREIKDSDYKSPKQVWNSDENSVELNAILRDSKKTVYSSRYLPEFEFIALNDPKKKNKFQHYATLNLGSFLSTFRAVVGIKESPPINSTITQDPDILFL